MVLIAFPGTAGSAYCFQGNTMAPSWTVSNTQQGRHFIHLYLQIFVGNSLESFHLPIRYSEGDNHS